MGTTSDDFGNHKKCNKCHDKSQPIFSGSKYKDYVCNDCQSFVRLTRRDPQKCTNCRSTNIRSLK